MQTLISIDLIEFFPIFVFFFFNDTATTEIYTLSLHDALPICMAPAGASPVARAARKSCSALAGSSWRERSEEHTSELQSPCNLVCRLLLEKKKHSPYTSMTVIGRQTMFEFPLRFTRLMHAGDA